MKAFDFPLVIAAIGAFVVLGFVSRMRKDDPNNEVLSTLREIATAILLVALIYAIVRAYQGTSRRTKRAHPNNVVQGIPVPSAPPASSPSRKPRTPRAQGYP